MAREVRDSDGTAWECVQAYAGLSNDPEKQRAAQVEEELDRYHVVCTPSGGAQSVRLELAGDWETSLSDEDLLREIDRARES